MKSDVSYKQSKVFNCFQQFLPAFFALYATGSHLTNCCPQPCELRPIMLGQIRSHRDRFFDKLDPSVVKPFGNRSESIPWSEGFPVSFNLRTPNIKECQKLSRAFITCDLFSVLSRVRVPPLAQEVSDHSAANTAANAAADEAHDYRFYAWHLIAGIAGGVFGGCFGALAYLSWAREIDLPGFRAFRRSKTVRPLESPYRIGGNTVTFHMTYIV